MTSPAELSARLLLADCGKAPVPDMTPEEAKAVARFQAGMIHGMLLDLASGDQAAVAETALMLLRRCQSPAN